MMGGVSDFLFGDDGPSAPSLQAPAPYVMPDPLTPMPEMAQPMRFGPAEMQAFGRVLDTISGTQYRTITNPDGSTTQVLERVPHQNPFLEQLTGTFRETLSRGMEAVNRLADFDPRAVTQYAPMVEGISAMLGQRSDDMRHLLGHEQFDALVEKTRQTQRTIIDDAFTEQLRATDEQYAHRGMADSSAARESRALLAKGRAEALAMSDLQATQAGQQFVAQDQETRAREYAVRESGRQGQAQDLERLYGHDVQEQQRQLQNASGVLDTAQGLRAYDDGLARSADLPRQRLAEFAALNEAMLQRRQQQIGEEQGSVSELNRVNLARWDAENTAQLNRNQMINRGQLDVTSATNAARLGQFDAELRSHESRGPSLGQTLGSIGGMALGGWLAGPVGGAAGGSSFLGPRSSTAGSFTQHFGNAMRTHFSPTSSPSPSRSWTPRRIF